MKERKNVRYTLVTEETEFGTEYGIICKENGIACQSIKKISTDKGFVRDMTEKFNRYKLASYQFYDAVEDCIP